MQKKLYFKSIFSHQESSVCLLTKTLLILLSTLVCLQHSQESVLIMSLFEGSQKAEINSNGWNIVGQPQGLARNPIAPVG